MFQYNCKHFECSLEIKIIAKLYTYFLFIVHLARAYSVSENDDHHTTVFKFKPRG